MVDKTEAARIEAAQLGKNLDLDTKGFGSLTLFEEVDHTYLGTYNSLLVGLL